jgi:hypothetical protein
MIWWQTPGWGCKTPLHVYCRGRDYSILIRNLKISWKTNWSPMTTSDDYPGNHVIKSRHRNSCLSLFLVDHPLIRSFRYRNFLGFPRTNEEIRELCKPRRSYQLALGVFHTTGLGYTYIDIKKYRTHSIINHSSLPQIYPINHYISNIDGIVSISCPFT